MNDIHKLLEKHGAAHFLSGLFRILTFFGNVTRKELVACCYYIDRCCEAHSAFDINYFDFHYEITQSEITVPELDNLICEIKEIKPNGQGGYEVEWNARNIYLSGRTSAVVELALTNIYELGLINDYDKLYEFVLNSSVEKYTNGTWVEEYNQKCK